MILSYVIKEVYYTKYLIWLLQIFFDLSINTNFILIVLAVN